MGADFGGGGFLFNPFSIGMFFMRGGEFGGRDENRSELWFRRTTGLPFVSNNLPLNDYDNPFPSQQAQDFEKCIGISLKDYIDFKAEPQSDPVQCAISSYGYADEETAQRAIDGARLMTTNSTLEQREIAREHQPIPGEEPPPDDDIKPPPGEKPPPGTKPPPAPKTKPPPSGSLDTARQILDLLKMLQGLFSGGSILDISKIANVLGLSMGQLIQMLGKVGIAVDEGLGKVAKASGDAGDKVAGATTAGDERIATATEELTKPTSLTEAIFKAGVINAEIDARALENFLPTLEEWIQLVSEEKELPPDQAESDLADTSSRLQDEFEGGTGERVPDVPVKTEIRVVATDNVHPWVKLNQLAREGASNKEVFDYLDKSEKDARGRLDNTLQGWADTLFKKFTDMMFNDVKNLGKVGPREGFDAAARLIQTALAAGMAAHISATLTEMAVPWKELGLNQVVGLLGDVGAFGPLVAETWGRAVHAAVGRAAEYQINESTRSRLLEVRDVIEAFRKRKMDQGDFSQHLLFHGLDTDQQQVMIDSLWRPPRLREVVLLAGDSSITEAEIVNLLQFAGYSDEHVDLETPIVFQQAIKAQRQTLLNEVYAQMRDGLMDDAEADLTFDRLRLQPTARQLLFDSAMHARHRERIGEHEKVLTATVTAGMSTILEYRSSLSALGIPEEKVDALVSIAEVKRSGKLLTEVKKEHEADIRKIQSLTISELKERFAEGEINQPGLVTLLLAAGVKPEAALAIASLEGTKLNAKSLKGAAARTAKLKQQIVRDNQALLIAAFRKGLLDEESLRAALLELGINSEIVTALVAEEAVRKIKPPKAAATARAT